MKHIRFALIALVLTIGILVFPTSSSVATSFACIATGEGRVTRFLILGSDRASGLSDSILLVSLNEGTREARILQIPRDTYAEYTEKSYKKLNGAMRTLGVRETKEMLAGAFGIKIDYFLVLKLEFFRALVDAIGGVELDVPQDMHYEDPAQDLQIRLRAGKTLLNGEMAEQFVRYRSGYVNADLGRLDAQKLFLAAFAKKCRSLSPVQVLQVMGLVLTGVQTDITLPAAIRVCRVLMECDPEQIPMATMAGQAVRGQSGAWYYVINRAGAVRMMRDYLMENDPEFDPQGIFDRESNPLFHAVYRAREEELPLL